MDTLILTNKGNTPLYVNDLGIEVEINQDFNILDSFTAEDITESLDFPYVYNQGAQIILVDSIGSHSMQLQDVLDYLTPLTKWSILDYEYISGKDDISDVTNIELEELTSGLNTSLHLHDDRYYTETELQTPGSATVHYENIIGSPTGSTKVVNGDMYFLDDIRGKWLSTAEEKYLWTENIVDGKYMKVGDATGGYLIPQDFTITKMSVNTMSGNQIKPLEIRVNGLNKESIILVNGKYISTSLNIDLYTGDELQMFVSGSGKHIKSVVVTLFGKWRTV